MREAFQNYVQHQNINRELPNRRAIKILSCRYDHNGFLQLKGTTSVGALTQLAQHGYVEHGSISSVSELDQQLTSPWDTIMLRGHGWFRRVDGSQRNKHLMDLREVPAYHLDCFMSIVLNWILNLLFKGTVVGFSADSLTKNAHPNLKNIILNTCSGGRVIISQGKDQRPTGMALDLAHRYPGVTVTGASTTVNNRTTRWQYLSSVEGRLEVSARMDGQEVSRTFCVDRDKNYRSIDDLKQAADRLEIRPADPEADSEFKHLLDHTKLTFEELQEVHDYCENRSYSDCVSMFGKAPWYRSFAKLTVAPAPTEPL